MLEKMPAIGSNVLPWSLTDTEIKHIVQSKFFSIQIRELGPDLLFSVTMLITALKGDSSGVLSRSSPSASFVRFFFVICGT